VLGIIRRDDIQSSLHTLAGTGPVPDASNRAGPGRRCARARIQVVSLRRPPMIAPGTQIRCLVVYCHDWSMMQRLIRQPHSVIPRRVVIIDGAGS